MATLIGRASVRVERTISCAATGCLADVIAQGVPVVGECVGAFLDVAEAGVADTVGFVDVGTDGGHARF